MDPEKGRVKRKAKDMKTLVGWFFCWGWSVLPSYTGILINHEIRIPINQSGGVINAIIVQFQGCALPLMDGFSGSLWIVSLFCKGFPFAMPVCQSAFPGM